MELQLRDAQWLRAYANLVSQALEKGNAQKAALYGYLVSRYHERLLVRQVEHLALAERKQMENRSEGDKKKAIPPHVVKFWRDRSKTIH